MNSDRPRILHTCFSRSWGGLELYCLDLCRLLRERGYGVWLACPAGSRMEEEAHRQGLLTIPLSVSGYFHPLLLGRLARFIRTNRPDLIHCHQSKDIATVVPAMILSRRRLPVILTKSVGSYIMKRDPLHRFTYSHVSRVLAISSVIHNNVVSTTPVPPDRVHTLHFPVDTKRFDPDRVDPQAVRREYGLDEKMHVVGFVGRFSPGKGHEELMTAAAILKNRYRNVRYLVAGEASYGEEPYEREIKSLARESGVDDIIIFTGFRTDIPEIMAAVDIFAFPSHAEAFGMVLIEAMAMRCPVVSTNCDGVLDIVVDGVTGLYVEPGRGEQLARAISRLLDDPSLRERMGNAGRERAVRLFDRHAHLGEIEVIYNDLAPRVIGRSGARRSAETP
ncbi:MAG: glycosyltransferase family 4 protein [Bacteroidota bacterium]